MYSGMTISHEGGVGETTKIHLYCRVPIYEKVSEFDNTNVSGYVGMFSFFLVFSIWVIICGSSICPLAQAWVVTTNVLEVSGIT